MSAALRAAALACALAGCIHADYQCTTNGDCDVGAAGRCELDHRCTQFDPSCATQRRYDDHAGAVSSACFDDHVAPANLCAAGQPPASPDDACLTAVCDALPTCCTTGWSEACVQQAQLRCPAVTCDTRIALTASKPGRTELWDLRWDGTAWTARLDAHQSVLAWLAPAPATLEPRLGGFAPGAFELDGARYPTAPGHSYLEATSVDFDRDGRATAVFGYTDGSGPHLEVNKLDGTPPRAIVSAGVSRLSWGDVDHDAFPDGVAEAGASTRYHLLSSIPGADHLREIDDRVSTTVTGQSTGTPPAVRSFDWIDFDGDHQLDVAVYGYSVDLHLGKGDAIGTTALIRIDCDPPGNANLASCDAPAQSAQAFAGAALAGTPNALIVATFPTRALYRVEVRGTPAQAILYPYAFPAEACGAACPPIVAVVTRDLDGDHALDVIAIDADLHVYTALASDSADLAKLKLHSALAVPTPTTGFVTVRSSVTGAPRASP